MYEKLPRVTAIRETLQNRGGSPHPWEEDARENTGVGDRDPVHRDGNVSLRATMGNSARLLGRVKLESPDDPAVPGLGVCPHGNWDEPDPGARGNRNPISVPKMQLWSWVFCGRL